MTPREHNRQPTIVVTRKPNLLRKAPITGPRIKDKPCMIDATHAKKQKKILVTTTDFRLRCFSRETQQRLTVLLL